MERLNFSTILKRKSRAAQMLGSLGGKKGGKARWAKLSRKERTAMARKMANARWAKYRAEHKHLEAEG